MNVDPLQWCDAAAWLEETGESGNQTLYGTRVVSLKFGEARGCMRTVAFNSLAVVHSP